MKINFLCSMVIALSFIHQSKAFAQTDFAAGTTSNEIVLHFNATINKERVLLNFTLDKNQIVDQIAVERSTNEKDFVMAGLVFGTDQPDKVDYLFYEKNKGSKVFYRLKVINKDRTFSYSSIISPEPAATKP